MIKMTAKKRFINGGTMVEMGEDFSVSSESIAQEFLSRDLARKQLHENKSHAPAEMKEPAPEGYLNYGAKTVPELKAIAKAQGLEGYSSMTKNQLIELLQNV